MIPISPFIRDNTNYTSSQEGSRFLVCDAGGSTVDTTAYIVQTLEPDLLLDEAKSSGCTFQPVALTISVSSSQIH